MISGLWVLTCSQCDLKTKNAIEANAFSPTRVVDLVVKLIASENSTNTSILKTNSDIEPVYYISW